MTPDARLIAIAVITIGTWAGYLLLRGPHTHPLFTMAVLARYSLVTAFLQFALGMIALLEFPVGASLLQNIFILDTAGQLCHVTWMSLLLGTTILVTYRTTKINATDRFHDYATALDAYRARPPAIWRPLRGLWRRIVFAFIDPQRGEEDFWKRRWLYLFLLSLPMPLGTFAATWEDMIQTGAPPGLRTALVLCGNLLLGVAVWFAIMLVTTVLHQLFLNRIVVDDGLFPLDRLKLVKDRWRIAWLDRRGQALARLLHHLGPGFSHLDPEDGWLLRPGHAQLFVYTTILLTGYAVSLLAMGVPREGQYFSALFGLLTMCLLVCLLTTGAAFLMDYFRVPLIVSVLLMSMFNWTVSGADCFYRLIDPSERIAYEAPAAQIAARDSYYAPLIVATEADQSPKTLVIVTAAGGGIQAAAWTARVLTGLHELYGNDFTQSVGIVSAVSGGSVGALYYLDAWSKSGHGLPDATTEDLRMIRERAMGSSLEATAWGWAGWDSVKSLAPFLVPTFSDRGWAIEKSWQENLLHPDDAMSDWGQRARVGNFPIVIFNATAVENGKRFMIDNLRLPKSPGFLGRRSDDNDAIELDERYAPLDIPPVTAARLSATFPYVSPICRPAQKVADPYHVADGGYIDNEGVVSALDWLDHLVADRKAGRCPSFDRVLVVRIMPFPDDEADDKFGQGGWLFAFAGPAEAIMNVRSSSQLERNHFGLAMMKQALRLEHIDFRVADFQFRRTNPHERCLPLSWKLSRMEKSCIEDAWMSLIQEAKLGSQSDNPIAKINSLGWFRGQ